MKTESSSDSHNAANDRAPVWATSVATFFGVGRLRPGPGTWGSLAAVLIWLGLSRFTASTWQTLTLAGMAALATAIGIPAATVTAKSSGAKDPQFVIIDAVAGQWIT